MSLKEVPTGGKDDEVKKPATTAKKNNLLEVILRMAVLKGIENSKERADVEKKLEFVRYSLTSNADGDKPAKLPHKSRSKKVAK